MLNLHVVLNQKCENIMRVAILYIILTVSIFGVAYSEDSGVFHVGEKITYEVSFWGFGLGKIEIITEGTEVRDGVLTYITKANIHSYDGIPFLTLHSVFKSWVDPECGCSRYFTASNKWKDKWDYQKITFNYNEEYVLNEKWYDKKKYLNAIYETDKRWNDGLSLFYFARKYLRLGRNVKIPTVMDRDTVFTYINFTKEPESIEIDAVEYPVKTIYFQGKADWT